MLSVFFFQVSALSTGSSGEEEADYDANASQGPALSELAKAELASIFLSHFVSF